MTNEFIAILEDMAKEYELLAKYNGGRDYLRWNALQAAVMEQKANLPSVTPLSEHEKFILSQMVNSDVKTIEEIGLMYQKQLVEIYQQQNFYLNR